MITKEEAIQMSQMMNYLQRADLFPNFAACSVSTANVDGIEGYIVEFCQYKSNTMDLDTVCGGGATLTEAMHNISPKIRSI